MDKIEKIEGADKAGTQFDAFLHSLTVLVKSFTTPWSLTQYGLIALAYGVALFIAHFLQEPFEARLRDVHGRPKLLRFLALVFRRLHWIFFALILWTIFAVLRGTTWPSRSYFILIAAGLVTAWVVIRIASGVIHNRTLSKAVALSAWAMLALQLTGLLDAASRGLDFVAFEVGSSRISLLLIVKTVILMALLLWLASIISDFLEDRLHKNRDLTPRLQVLISKTLKITLFVFAFFVALSAVGVDLTALTVFSGAVGLGIGFGLQKTVSNLLSGMIILLDKSIKPGDVISLEDTYGWISALRARYVSVVTRNGQEFLIPNEDFITQKVVNWSHSSNLVRLEVPFGVSYNSNPHEIRKLALEAVKDLDRISVAPQPVCFLKAFGGSSLDFVLRFWIKDPEKGLTNIRGAVLLGLWDAFKEHGVDIPFPHREIIMRDPAKLKS